MKPKLFVTQPIEASALMKLTSHLDVEVHPDAMRPITKEALIRGIQDRDYLLSRLGDQIDAEVIESNPELRLIATMVSSVGQSGIDMEAATKFGIPVIGRPSVAGSGQSGITAETADMTWALLMAVARRVIEGDRLAKQGIFPGPHSMYLLGSQVNGKQIGIVGMGKIGQAVAKRAKAFDMTICYASTRRHPDVEETFGALYMSLEDLLRTADFVSLHPQYTPETHHMIGERQLGLMKPSAFLINTSRGPVVDTQALVEALLRKRIAGAALDVVEGEPFPVLPPELTTMSNVVITPHLGSAVAEKREIMSNEIADEVIAFYQGKRPRNVFNPAVRAGLGKLDGCISEKAAL